MDNEYDNNGEGQLSPEKEQEITNRILKRAELAQMTRQLKMKLSKVPTSREGSPVKNRRKRVADGNDLEIKEAIARVSPVKKDWTGASRLRDGKVEQEAFGQARSPVKEMRRPSTPPPAPPTSSSSTMRDIHSSMDGQAMPSTPAQSRHRQKTALPAVISTAHDGKVTSYPQATLSTPQRGINGKKGDHSENEVGADLLMFLATSPYTSSASGSRQTRMPSTPMAYMSHGVGPQDPEDPIRFSHMKPSISSPQSTFKVPNHVISHSYNQGSSHMNSSASDALIEAPTIYASTANSPSPSKRRHMVDPGLIPTTPSRELRSSHLLKTPNFNMGDYVHALFSPSPRVPNTASNRPATAQDLRNTRS